MAQRLIILRRAAAAAAMAFPFLSAAPADAGYYRYNACVIARYETRLLSQWCDDYCERRVHYGRAFRVLDEDGRYLLVRNRSMCGWIKLRALRLVPQAYCRAAGI